VDKSICLIAVTGFCGTGKTTISRMLEATLQDAIVIAGDVHLISSTLKYTSEFESIFKMSFDSNNPAFCLSKGVNSGATPFCEYIELIHPYVNEQLLKNIATITTENSSIQYIIIEWGALARLQVWNKAQYRIMIDAPKVERNQRLMSRPHHPQIPMSEYENAGIFREAALCDIMKKATNVNYLVYNTYDDYLARIVDYLCQKITMGCGDLLLPL